MRVVHLPHARDGHHPRGVAADSRCPIRRPVCLDERQSCPCARFARGDGDDHPPRERHLHPKTRRQHLPSPAIARCQQCPGRGRTDAGLGTGLRSEPNGQPDRPPMVGGFGLYIGVAGGLCRGFPHHLQPLSGPPPVVERIPMDHRERTFSDRTEVLRHPSGRHRSVRLIQFSHLTTAHTRPGDPLSGSLPLFQSGHVAVFHRGRTLLERHHRCLCAW